MFDKMKTESNCFLCNFNKVDITPDKPVYLSGFANRSDKSSGIHLPLLSLCLLVGGGKNRVCIISNDFMELAPEIVEFISEQIAKKTELDKTDIFIHSIHTHSAPVMSEMLLKNTSSSGNDIYRELTIQKIIDNAVKTVNEKESYTKCSLKVGVGESALGICRRAIDPETGLSVIGKKSSSNAKQKLYVMEFKDTSGKPYITAVNYACHPVTLHENNLAVSSDYVGVARNKIEEKLNSNVIFLNGAAGDINPDFPMGNDTEITSEAGRLLAEDVLRLSYKNIDYAGIISECIELHLPYKNRNMTSSFIDDEVERKSSEKTDFYDWPTDLKSWAETMKAKLDKGQLINYRKTKIGAVKLSNIILFFSQGEIFSKYQDELRSQFPEYAVLFVGYTGCEAGYLPDYDSFKNGGYEVEQAYVYLLEPSPLSIESCNIYAEKSNQLICDVIK
ncbi:MAG TPA: neutral/alkaline non-lysosomal ceramidase N-terminal domain-containing protein [Victivallales bacterium]|nr:neutral/alkaline non-lysosomal ceramidase N-terminal domain-containing protein [Victivallales bacterium]